MSLYTQIIGVIAVVLGVGWLVAPRTMIDLQYNVLYFWTDDENTTEHASETAGRIGGLLLAVLGGALAAGVQL